MPSNLYNMCLQSYKVHLVPALLLQVYQGLLQVIIICVSHRAQRSLQQCPQPQLMRRMLKLSSLQRLYTLLWGIFPYFALFP